MNTVNLIGNLTKDIELKYGQTGTAFANGSIAVQRNFKNQSGEYDSDFINIKAFGKTAELLANHFSKGSKIGVTGSIQTGRYEKDGRTVYTTDVIVRDVTFVERKQSTGGVQGGGNTNTPNRNQNSSNGSYGGNNDPFGGSGIQIDEDSLPF